MRKGIHCDIKQIAENIAISADAKAEVGVLEIYDATLNDERVTARGAGTGARSRRRSDPQ